MCAGLRVCVCLHRNSTQIHQVMNAHKNESDRRILNKISKNTNERNDTHAHENQTSKFEMNCVFGSV